MTRTPLDDRLRVAAHPGQAGIGAAGERGCDLSGTVRRFDGQGGEPA